MAFRTLVDYKARIVHELDRCKQLKIKRAKRRGSGSSDESGDSDFEDVVKEGLELDFDPDVVFESNEVPASILRQIDQMERKEREKPSNSEPQPGPSNWKPTEQVEESPVKVPTLAFGLDLKYWGQDVEPALIPRNEFDGHPFWRASEPR
jgi:hypothetical protein